MKAKISLLNIFLLSIYCLDNPLDGVIQKSNNFGLIKGFNTIPFSSDLIKLPDSFFSDIIKLKDMKPPIKLDRPTNVRTPPAEEVKRHWYHATYIYCPFSKLIDFTCFKGCTDYKILKTFEDFYYGSFAMVGVEPSTKEIIISHRGSINVQNGLLGFSYDKVRMPNTPEGVLVHEGYLKVYESLASKINGHVLEMLADPKYKGYKVVILGHSLGAVVSIVHAVDMTSKFKEKGFETEIYSYHSPRPGNEVFREYAISQNFTVSRFTNKNDYASQLAPRQLGFTHIPGEFHSDSNNIARDNFHECSQEYDEDPNCDWKEIKTFANTDHVEGFGNLINLFC